MDLHVLTPSCPPRRSSVRLGFSLDKSQVTLPTPDFSGTITGSYTVPLTRLGGNLVFSGDYFFTDKFGGDLGENIPGYQLTNFRITWNGVEGSKLDAAVLVSNAFDRMYIDDFTGKIVRESSGERVGQDV